jgi:hypothetical protein
MGWRLQNPAAMKTKLATLLVALLCSISVFVTGCATTKGGATRAEQATPNLRSIAAVIGVGTLVAAPDLPTKQRYAQFMVITASLVRAAIDDGVLDVNDFSDQINNFLGKQDDQDLQTLGASLISLYHSLYPNVKADLGKYKVTLEAIAAGLEDAARPYVKRAAALSLEPSQEEIFFLFYEFADPDAEWIDTEWASIAGGSLIVG